MEMTKTCADRWNWEQENVKNGRTKLVLLKIWTSYSTSRSLMSSLNILVHSRRVLPHSLSCFTLITLSSASGSIFPSFQIYMNLFNHLSILCGRTAVRSGIPSSLPALKESSWPSIPAHLLTVDLLQRSHFDCLLRVCHTHDTGCANCSLVHNSYTLFLGY